MTRRALTLFELLIVTLVISLAMLPLFTLNRSSQELTLDASYEFLALQLAQEPIEVFRAVGYPACTTLADYPLGAVLPINRYDDRYPPEAAMFERLVVLDDSRLPQCVVTVQVFPRADTAARSWMRSRKAAIVVKGSIPVVP